MSFFGIFNKIGHALSSPASQGAVTIGAAALTVYNPGLGALVEMIANAVYAVQQTAGAAAGADKKHDVKAIVDISAPVTLALLEKVTGKPIADPAALAPSIDRLIDDLVEMFHALGVFAPHKTDAPPAV